MSLDETNVRNNTRHGNDVDMTFASAYTTPGRKKGARLDATMNISELLHSDDPDTFESTELCELFLDAVQRFPTSTQVFELIEEFEVLCDDQILRLEAIVKRIPDGDPKVGRAASRLGWLRAERSTWQLTRALYSDRINQSSGDGNDAMIVDSLINRQTCKQVIESLIGRDSTVRESQMVVDWLERVAMDDNKWIMTDSEQYFEGHTTCWENTKGRLDDRAMGVNDQRQLVTELDPDAPLRQRLPLDDLDQKDEIRLLKIVFGYIRSGQLDEARKLCLKCGQAWRAATLEGWRLYHDPNFDEVTMKSDDLTVEGNKYRSVWKKCAWRMSNDDRLSNEERAVYGVLSGNLKAVLPTCQMYEDYLWAFLRTMIEARVCAELDSHSTAAIGNYLLESPDVFGSQYGEKLSDPKHVFEQIDAVPNDVIRQRAKEPFPSIQRYIILDDINKLMNLLFTLSTSNGVQQKGALPHADSLARFMTHLVLFLRTIGLGLNDDSHSFVIENYIKVLVKNSEIDLVAPYCSYLPPTAQITLYASFLEVITDPDEREKCLRLAEEHNLNVAAITNMVVVNICTKSVESQDVRGPLLHETTEEDNMKINAIDWLMFDTNQRAEALWHANALMRSFLLSRKIEAARDVALKMKTDTIEIIYKNGLAKSTELPPEEANTVREFMCIQAYLKMHDSFNDWFDLNQNQRPRRPDQQKIQHNPAMSAGSHFMERYQREQQEKQFLVDTERWKGQMRNLTKTTKDHLYNILLFPDGGWMVDSSQQQEDEQDQVRVKQMSDLRRMCIPESAVLLHKVMMSVGYHAEYMQLAGVIASEEYKLYDAFDRDTMRTLLKGLKEAALNALAENKKDPIGISI